MAVDTFTDATSVRREAGFQDNTDISTTDDIDGFVDSANSEVTSYVASAYQIPLSSIPTYSGSSAEYFLQNIAMRLAAGQLLQRMYVGMGGSMYEEAQKKASEARSQLKRIAKRNILLFGSDGEELPVLGGNDNGINSVSGFPNASSNPPIFSTDQVF